MKTEVGQVVGYKSKGNVYDVPAGTIVRARIESLVTRPGSNIRLQGNPVNLRVFPPGYPYDPATLREDFVITHVLEGDGVGEWTADFEEDEGEQHVAEGGETLPADRLERVVAVLKLHGIHVDPMEPVRETAQDRIEGSPMPLVDPEAAARVSYEKDKTIDALREANEEQARDITTLQSELDAMTQERNQLQDKLAQNSEGQQSGS